MFNFIICDDQKEFIKKYAMVIDKLLMKNNIDYYINEFTGYNKGFEKIIKSDMSSKIYILDIELTNGISGIDIARKIRETDWNSTIILVTSHSELGYEALKAQIMVLDFISKFDDCEKNLERVLKLAVNKIDNKKVIVFKNNGMTHRLYLDDILYVVKDTVDRKCIIKTTYSEFSVNKTMSEMIEELGSNFYLTHRSCLVNLDKVRKVNWKENIIYFANGETIDLLSRDRKKEFKKYVSMP